jgi:hypothetical protein
VTDVNCRAKLLRQRARRKNTSPELKKLVAKWKLQEQKMKLLKTNLYEFRRSHSEVFRKKKEMMRKLLKRRLMAKQAKRMVGLYTDEEIKLPLIVSERH